jgi:hypothetical protein
LDYFATTGAGRRRTRRATRSKVTNRAPQQHALYRTRAPGVGARVP